MKYTLLLSLLISINVLTAQEIIEPCKFGQPLIDALQSDYTPNNPLGYGPARDILYSEIDNNGNDLSGIYTNYTVTLNPNDDPSSSAFQNGAGLNAEHVYPQSLGASNEPMKSDLHNIFPCKVNVNEARGSCPFGEIDDDDTDKWYALDIQANNIPSTDIDTYSEKDQEDCFFEPREAVKGDIARAIFYFYAIYQSIADGENANFFPLQKTTLHQWHLDDPVDDKETDRNQLIAAQQGNPNPFILDPTLAQRAFFEADASYPEGDGNCFSTTPVTDLATNNWVTISTNVIQKEVTIYSEKDSGSILLFNTQGQMVREQRLVNESYLLVEDLPQGIYMLQIRSEGLVRLFTIFKQ